MAVPDTRFDFLCTTFKPARYPLRHAFSRLLSHTTTAAFPPSSTVWTLLVWSRVPMRVRYPHSHCIHTHALSVLLHCTVLQGLGNAFLSNISACDAIFHMTRACVCVCMLHGTVRQRVRGWCTGAFEDDDIIHVEGEVNPVRDLEIIHNELRLKVHFVHSCMHVCILTCAVLDAMQDLEASATLLV